MKKSDINKIQFLLIDFCNIKEITHENILNLQKKYRIFHTLRGEKLGYEEWCSSKKAPKIQRYYLIEDEEIKKIVSDVETLATLPSDPKSDELLHYLHLSQSEYKNFLDKCIDGTLDLNFLNKVIDDLEDIGIEYIKSEDEWRPDFIYNKKYLRFFEDFINWEILKYFLYHVGYVFGRVKKCKWCHLYFLYRRKDQKYCNDKCSSNYRSQIFKEKNPKYYKRYMREQRGKGS